ncbi:MAG: RagB/SusD family nutrient uptake outer membrane protein [Bacteroidales bacterium]|nr:RagB/SusD family nutrient uptake outer membrane protein [Bacteroidales bacterium]
MKKIILLISIFITFLACQEDFLEEKPVTVLTQSFYKTAEGLEALVNGSYQVFRFETDYNPGNFLFGSANDCEVFLANQDAARLANGLYRPDAWGADASTDGLHMAIMVNNLVGEISGDYVEGMYPVINRCNVFLENFPQLGEDDQKKVADSKGEILFIRAYCYYLLTNVLGDVPLILKSFEGMPASFYFPKSSIEDIYKIMIADLREAVELLPENTPDLGRVARPAAAHLLAKLYLHRAQAAEWQNSPETHLAMLYKGNVATDLDSCIYYATVAIDIKKGQTTAGGLAPNFGDLWAVAGYVTENTNYPRDLVKEIMLSAQYTFSTEYNGRYGDNHQFVHIYDQDYTVLAAGVSRDYQDYPRPFRAIGPNDWAYDMFTNKDNDSRFYKTFIPEYSSNDQGKANSGVPWDTVTAYYYNTYLKDKYTDYYDGDSAVAGKSKIQYEKRSLVFIENSKDEPVDSLWLASQPFLILARWTACSPGRDGYDAVKDIDGNITGFEPGEVVDPLNPVVSDVSDRDVRYRITSDPGLERYGCDAIWDRSSLAYLSTAKWWDLNRGEATRDRGAGTIDIPLIRLAETYLVRAEAHGRKGDYNAAIDDINVIRKRAAYHPGEKRSEILVTMEPGIFTGRMDIPANEQTAPYTVSTDSYEKIRVTGDEWLDGTEKAKKENYPPTVSNHPTSDPALNRFVHFIYNEKAREFLFELQITEDLHNAGILYDRVYYRDYFGAPATSTGTEDHPFPYDQHDVALGQPVGAIGTGRGQFDKHHTFKAWPIGYLQLLTDEEGNALTAADRQEYQNPGY